MGRIEVVVIPTNGRVDSLERALVSQVVLAKTFDRDPEFVIADDTPSAQYREHTRGLLRSIACCYGTRISYSGMQEKRAFADRLANEADVPQAVVDFALFGCTSDGGPGANRNVLLLDTLDRLFFSLDDDTISRAFVPLGVEGASLDVHSAEEHVWDGFGQPADFVWRFVPDLDAAVSSARPTHVDVLGAHELLLGKDLASIESLAELRVIKNGPTPFRAPPKSARVMFTMNGLLGDVGVDERWHLLAGTAEVLRQLRREDTHLAAREGRTVVRCARRPTLTRWVGLHGMFFGADHCRTLPPFFPQYRGEDTLMGSMMRRCYPDDLFGFLSFALIHAPPPRAFQRGFEYLLCNNTMATVLIDLLASPEREVSPEGAIAAMGRSLKDTAERSPSDFADLLRSRWQPAEPAMEEYLSTLRAAGLDHVERDLQIVLHTSRRARSNNEGSLPHDVLKGRNEADASKLTQTLVGRFGELLEAWATLCDAARSLRAQGIRPSTPLM